MQLFCSISNNGSAADYLSYRCWIFLTKCLCSKTISFIKIPFRVPAQLSDNLWTSRIPFSEAKSIVPMKFWFSFSTTVLFIKWTKPFLWPIRLFFFKSGSLYFALIYVHFHYHKKNFKYLYRKKTYSILTIQHLPTIFSPYLEFNHRSYISASRVRQNASLPAQTHLSSTLRSEISLHTQNDWSIFLSFYKMPLCLFRHKLFQKSFNEKSTRRAR